MRPAARPSPLLSRVGPLALALAWLSGALGGCGPGAAERAELRLPSLRDLPAPAPGEPRRRVVLIGIDGASWDFLDPLLEQGELPNLARLVRTGARARLRSLECHFTPPAWTAMLTGEPPERTGIHTFGRFDRAAREFVSVSSADLVVPTVWDVASFAGRRVAVVNVPVTYPAWPVNGVMVSGIMTPSDHGPAPSLRPVPFRGRIPYDGERRVFSPVVTGALGDELNLMRVALLDTTDDGESRADRVELSVFAPGDAQRRAELSFPVGEFSPWVPVRVRRDGEIADAWTRLRFGPSGLSVEFAPTFFALDLPFTYPPSLAAELERRFGFYLPHQFLPLTLVPRAAKEAAGHALYFLDREAWDLFAYVFGSSDNMHHLVGFGPEAVEVYREIDRFLGELVERMGPETTLVVASDHGFAEYEHRIDVNRRLADVGLLRQTPDGGIDFDRSLVFHNLWHLWFEPAQPTREALESHGVRVAAGETPRAALERRVREALAGIRSRDGRPFPVEAHPVAPGAAGDPPDMRLRGSYDGYRVEFWNLTHRTRQVVSSPSERWAHERDGILLIAGDSVRPGADLGTLRIQDVAPLLLDRMGLPVSESLEGRLPAGFLRGEAARRQPVLRVASYAEVAPRRAAPPADPRSFEERLRALGYTRD